MRIKDIITEAVKQRLDPKCWKGKHKEGTKIKGRVRVNNCVPNEGVAEGAENLNYIGNCTQDDVIEHIFGDATGFAQAVDEYGDEFTLDDLVVKYDPETDVHSFYYKEQGVAENAENLHIGDPIIITGKGIEFEGTTGEIVSFGQQNRFVVVNLYNHGKHSFHSSDVSYNEYAGSDEEEARAYDSDPDARNWNMDEQGVAEGATVTRIDSNPITDFGSSLKAYKHTDDWSQSGVDTGDDSYWKNKNLKTNTTKGLFAGDPRRTALYATGNAHETRYVEFTQNGQPIVYFDRKDLPAMRSRKTYLTVFDASDFRQLPTGEWFSENPSKPIKQVPIGDPFKYIADQGWIVRVTDDLDKVFKQVKNMHKAGKIAQYGAEGMNESKQGVAEGQGEQISKTKALNILRKELMNSYEYMKCANLEEFKNRLQWLSEGMLKNHMTDGKSTVINSEEIKLYQEYRKKREQIQRGLTQGVAEDWNKVNHHDKTDGLSQKAVNAYRREHPGSKLKTAVTTKPSKLKAGSKDAKRRKSFCARMSGNKGPMKDEHGKPTPKAKALRRWNCESVEEMVDMIIENMDHAKDNQAVPELKAALLAKKSMLQTASEDDVYDVIDEIMTRIAKSHGMSGQKLHAMWVDKYDQIPDTWIMK